MYANFNIGHMHPDCGMAGYYNEPDYAEAERQENRRLLEYAGQCRKIAKDQAYDFATANGKDYYWQYGFEDPENQALAWHEWLIESAEELDAKQFRRMPMFGKTHDLANAMRLLVSTGADFTTLDFVVSHMATVAKAA